MKYSRKLNTLLAFIIPTCIQCFTFKSSPAQTFQNTKPQKLINAKVNPESSLPSMNRRSIMIGTIAFLTGIQTNKYMANAEDNIASVTVTEFEDILEQSARSIKLVDFSGPKSETVVVTLLDGTLFTVSDVVDSPTDPRSPLAISALCRGYKVPTRFSSLLGAVQGAPKKKKVYMNSREVEAAKKEKEKKERLAKDEEDRLEELKLMQDQKLKMMQEEEKLSSI